MGREYACHYCGRTNGKRTRDHKVPRVYGGALLGATNIVLCCALCNTIKGAREYGTFAAFFQEFLAAHGDEYRTADPDGPAVVMKKQFSRWLKKFTVTESRAA